MTEDIPSGYETKWLENCERSEDIVMEDSADIKKCKKHEKKLKKKCAYTKCPCELSAISNMLSKIGITFSVLVGFYVYRICTLYHTSCFSYLYLPCWTVPQRGRTL